MFFKQNRGTKYITYILPVLSALLLTMLIGCSSTQNTPEQDIKDLVKKAENLFEEHKGAKLKKLVSNQYLDSKERTKKEIDGLISYYLFTHKNIHILAHISDIDFTTDKRCNVVLYGATAGTSGNIKELFTMTQGDVQRYTFTLDKSSGDWQLVSALWERATTEDIEEIIKSLE